MPAATPLTSQEFEVAIAEAAKGVAPAQIKPTSVLEVMIPYRKTLMDYRDRGYSAKQLVQFMRHPKIGINVSASCMRRFLLTKRRTARKSAPSSPGASPKAGA